MKATGQAISVAARTKRKLAVPKAPKSVRKISTKPKTMFSRRDRVLGLLLFVGTLLLYSPTRNYSFINFDDDAYVYTNAHVLAGLNWETVRWALTSTEQGSNWLPVTWLSHALDCQLFGGEDAGYHHIVNEFIHAVNVVLLFIFLQRATGAVWSSFFVAGLFAWHPLNVESVAWIAERKNVLSTLFLLLAIGAYGWYVQKPGWKRYGIIIAAFLLALASKPMVVTLPFVLLLLDYWPLQRVKGSTDASAPVPIPQRSFVHLIVEKLPLFVLSAAGSAITVWVQRSAGAVKSTQTFPLSQRLGNAVFSYFMYISKMFWPFGLSIFYPHPGPALSAWKVVLAAMTVCGITLLVLRQRRARPFLAVGWFWFLGTLVPVIGIVQVGSQAMADRYAYVPLIGLFIMLAWGAAEFFERRRTGTNERWILGLVVLVTVGLMSSRQLGYWQNSATLWSHSLEVTAQNSVAEKYLAKELVSEGNIEDALTHFLKAETLEPKNVEVLVNLGALHSQKGEYNDAIQELESAIKLMDQGLVTSDKEKFARSPALLNLGFAYGLTNDYSRATTNLQKAYQSDPQVVDQAIQRMKASLASDPSEGTYVNLVLLLRARGNNDEAAAILEDAIHTHPEYSGVRSLMSFTAKLPPAR